MVRCGRRRLGRDAVPRVLVMLVFALLGLPRYRPRHLAGFGAGFVLGGLPFAVSGRFEGVVGFFRGSFELVSEYSRAMAYQQPRRRLGGREAGRCGRVDSVVD